MSEYFFVKKAVMRISFAAFKKKEEERKMKKATQNEIDFGAKPGLRVPKRGAAAAAAETNGSRAKLIIKAKRGKDGKFKIAKGRKQYDAGSNRQSGRSSLKGMDFIVAVPTKKGSSKVMKGKRSNLKKAKVIVADRIAEGKVGGIRAKKSANKTSGLKRRDIGSNDGMKFNTLTQALKAIVKNMNGTPAAVLGVKEKKGEPKPSADGELVLLKRVRKYTPKGKSRK